MSASGRRICISFVGQKITGPFMACSTYVPGVSKGCFLEVFKYLGASKKHSFVTPGISFYFLQAKRVVKVGLIGSWSKLFRLTHGNETA